MQRVPLDRGPRLARELAANRMTGRLSARQRLALLIAAGIGCTTFPRARLSASPRLVARSTSPSLLIVGFGLHNPIEDLGMVAPLPGGDARPGWGFLALLGLIGGGPTLIGPVLGQVVVSDVLSVGFLSRAAGSILYVVMQLLKVADKMGRKPTMLMCLVIMAIGMYMAHGATAVWPMTLFRVFTGVGIGGMLAATNAVTAESTSKSSRSLAMALYVVGYPLGGIFGGLAATQWLLVDYTWQAVFLFGAITTAAMIPLVMLLVPETPAFHAARRKPDALQRVNRSLRALVG